MGKKLKALMLVLLLSVGVLFQSTETAKASSDSKVYYVETDEDELVALQRVMANRETDFTIRYLESNLADLSMLALEIPDSDVYHYKGIHKNTYGGFADLSKNSNDGEEYVYAKGQKWESIDIQYKYEKNRVNESIKLNDDVRKLIKSSGIATKSDYERVKWAHDWVSNNVSYDVKSNYAQDAFYNKKANCEGYSGLFQLFAKELGINTISVIGLAYNGTWGGHAWDLVKFDGEWYQLDTTWDNVWGNKYFLKGTDSFDVDHNTWFYDESEGFIFSETDFVKSSQNSGVPGSLYGAPFDPVVFERLNIGEEYQWQLSNPDAIKFDYKSSNPAVATIDSKGKIVGLKAGKTAITAENKELNIKEIIEITVSKEKATVKDYTTIKSAKAVAVDYGKTAPIKLTLSDNGGKLEGVKYTSSNKAIATVDKNGKVTGVKAGTTYVTISYTGGKSVKVKVTVKPVVNRKAVN